MATSVLVCSSVRLIAEGVGSLLAKAESIRLLGIASSINELTGLLKQDPDVIVSDYAMGRDILSNSLADSPLKLLFIHELSSLSTDFEDLRAMIAKGLVGILTSNADTETLCKAIDAVAQGELWLDRKMLCKTLCRRQEGPSGRIPLTSKEVEVLHHLCDGLSNKEIGRKLFICENTVKSHCNHLYKKFSVSNRVKLILLASEMLKDSEPSFDQ